MLYILGLAYSLEGWDFILMYYDAIVIVNAVTMVACMIGFRQIIDLLQDIRDSLENEREGDE